MEKHPQGLRLTLSTKRSFADIDLPLYEWNPEAQFAVNNMEGISSRPPKSFKMNAHKSRAHKQREEVDSRPCLDVTLTHWPAWPSELACSRMCRNYACWRGTAFSTGQGFQGEEEVKQLLPLIADEKGEVFEESFVKYVQEEIQQIQ